MKKQSKSDITVPIRIVLVAPPSGVDFGIQEGKGNDYKTISIQRSKVGELVLECSINVKGTRADGPPNFAGPTSQGPPTGRFIYIDIGKSAGQFNSEWQRRIKIPLEGITWEMIDKLSIPKLIMQVYLRPMKIATYNIRQGGSKRVHWKKMINDQADAPKRLLVASIPGTGKDGGPS